ncbi:hypothetical protein Trydic_g7070 [Trypoxylus dichotomus]
MIFRESGMGTLVKRETTSKLTNKFVSGIVIPEMSSTKYVECKTCDEALSVYSLRNLARYLARLYVGESMVLTIGRNGGPSLGILGRPHNRGGLGFRGIRRC